MTKIPLKKSPLSLMILSIVSGHLYAETAVEPDNVQQLNTIVISAEQNANPQQQYTRDLIAAVPKLTGRDKMPEVRP